MWYIIWFLTLFIGAIFKDSVPQNYMYIYAFIIGALAQSFINMATWGKED